MRPVLSRNYYVGPAGTAAPPAFVLAKKCFAFSFVVVELKFTASRRSRIQQSRILRSRVLNINGWKVSKFPAPPLCGVRAVAGRGRRFCRNSTYSKSAAFGF